MKPTPFESSYNVHNDGKREARLLQRLQDVLEEPLYPVNYSVATGFELMPNLIGPDLVTAERLKHIVAIETRDGMLDKKPWRAISVKAKWPLVEHLKLLLAPLERLNPNPRSVVIVKYSAFNGDIFRFALIAKHNPAKMMGGREWYEYSLEPIDSTVKKPFSNEGCIETPRWEIYQANQAGLEEYSTSTTNVYCNIPGIFKMNTGTLRVKMRRNYVHHAETWLIDRQEGLVYYCKTSCYPEEHVTFKGEIIGHAERFVCSYDGVKRYHLFGGVRSGVMRYRTVQIEELLLLDNPQPVGLFMNMYLIYRQVEHIVTQWSIFYQAEPATNRLAQQSKKFTIIRSRKKIHHIGGQPMMGEVIHHLDGSELWLRGFLVNHLTGEVFHVEGTITKYATLIGYVDKIPNCIKDATSCHALLGEIPSGIQAIQ